MTNLKIKQQIKSIARIFCWFLMWQSFNSNLPCCNQSIYGFDYSMVNLMKRFASFLKNRKRYLQNFLFSVPIRFLKFYNILIHVSFDEIFQLKFLNPIPHFCPCQLQIVLSMKPPLWCKSSALSFWDEKYK